MRSVSQAPLSQPAHLPYPPQGTAAPGDEVSFLVSKPASFEQKPAASTEATAGSSTWRAKISLAWDLAKRKVRAAREKLRHALDERFKPAIRKLFGKDLTPSEAQRLDRQLEKIEKRLEASSDDNVHTSDATHAGGWAQRGVPGGYIYLTAPSIEAGRERLAEVIIHEASHSEANTSDHWYVHPDLSRFNNFYTGTTFDPQIDFDLAMDNADTIRYAVTTLSSDVPLMTQTEETIRDDALRMMHAIKRELSRPWSPETTRAMESLFGKSPLTEQDRRLIADNFESAVSSNFKYAQVLIDERGLDPGVLDLPRKDRAMAALDWATKGNIIYSPEPQDFEHAARHHERLRSMTKLMLAHRKLRRAQAPQPGQTHQTAPRGAPPSPVSHVDRRTLPGPVEDMGAFDAFIASRPTPSAFKARYPDVQLAFFGIGFARTPGKDIYVASLDTDGRLRPGYFAARA